MRFVFEEGKASEAAAYLLRRNHDRLPQLKLAKLLYLADRRSLVETGYTVTGAKMVSTDQGPGLSEIESRLAWEGDAESNWSRLIGAPSGYEVSLRETPGFQRLSEYETDLLDQVFEQCGSWESVVLIAYLRDLPEWTDPTGSAYPIDVRVILREAGKSDEEIQAVSAQAEAIWSFRNVGALAR